MNAYERLQIHLDSSADSSRRDIQSGFYPHADRDLFGYRELIPNLDSTVQSLAGIHKPILCLDAGCGTSRAVAELEASYLSQLIATGITLVIHPPVSDYPVLPKSRLYESSIRDAHFDIGHFNLILAVGSIDTSNTVLEEGRKLIELLSHKGVFLFAPTTIGIDDKESMELMKWASSQGIKIQYAYSKYDLPVYTLYKP